MENPLQICGKRLVNDIDYKLTTKQIEALIEKILGAANVTKIDNQYMIKKRKISLLIKNITYLGYDRAHDDYRIDKKRIQASSWYLDCVNINKNNGIKTFYVGIYSYEAERDFLYAIFDPDSYNGNMPNNSSCHLSVYDLLSAKTRGHFFKIDNQGRKIYILNQKNFVDFLLNEESEILRIAEDEYRLLLLLKKFWDDIPLELQGDECYQQMFDEAYSKTFEVEWPGFYQEFLFDKFLENNPTNLVAVYGDKTKDGIDLDLIFPCCENFYGDLKADNESFDIQGNKKDTIDRVINNNGHIWYVVAAFSEVVLDKVMNFEVLAKYNELKQLYNDNEPRKSKQKKISDDYKDKMKNKISMKNFYVLDINAGNIEFLSDYNQGKNSDGSVRTVKYKISKKQIEQFKIFEYKK